METKTQAHASKKLVKKWEYDLQVGIYDSILIVRLYADRAVARVPHVRWVGSTGGYAERYVRIDGADLAALLRIAQQEIDDDADYTDRVALRVLDYARDL